LIPDNQAASYLAPILIVKQTSQLKSRHNFLSKDGLSRILLKLWQIEVPGKDHVESYLRDQYRRNFRLNSIRNMLIAIASFLVLVQQDGKNCLEEITRADLGAFIEHMQDRGLKASTVRTRLESLKGFIRYQVEKGVVSSDVLLRRMIIKVPDSFQAMGKIERGEIDGYYKLDLELQEILEKKELLSQNGKKLYEQS
jgi:hypothetical protein